MASWSRISLGSAACVALALSLTGCSLLPSGPARDADGRVTSATEMAATELLVGDCFSYLGDGSDLTTVTVAPCSSEHGFIVVDEGSLSTAQVDEAGGLQVAVSVACKEKYSVFTTALAEGLRSELTFLVSAAEVDGATVNNYSCVAVDPTSESATEASEN